MSSNDEIINFGYNKTDNIPKIAYILNNGGSNDIKFLNYIYMIKDKNSWNYSCRFKGCGSSISLKTGMLETVEVRPLVPFQPTYLFFLVKFHQQQHWKNVSFVMFFLRNEA